MQLKRLYIHNYKSFYDTTIELGKFNIVVGENNSGKSNLIDVLEFINIAMRKDIERAISDKGGYDNLKNYRTDEEKVIIRATFDKNDRMNYVTRVGSYMEAVYGEGEFTLSFSFTKTTIFFSLTTNLNIRATQDTQLAQEILEHSDNIFKLDVHNVKIIILDALFIKSSKEKQRILDCSKKNKKFLEEHLKAILSSINIVNKNKLTTIKFNGYTTKKDISTYYFNTDSIKEKSHLDSDSELQKDGSNLGKNIAALSSMSKLNFSEFEIVSNSLITTVNELDSINIHKVADNYILTFLEGDKEISINKVSDGTINLLATITALNQPQNRNLLLAFEEPERHLHLKAVNYLIEEFRANEKQILITTHSTEILKHANIDEIIFIYRDSDGDTQAIRADEIPNLEEMMKDMAYERPWSLDEMISSGIVGDFE